MNIKVIFLFLWTLYTLSTEKTPPPGDCKVVKPGCSCQYSDGSVVDLSSLGNQDGTPKYQKLQVDQGDGNKYDYYYNPCYDFTKSTCTNAAACQNDPSSGFVIIGLQGKKSTFKVKNNMLAIEYSNDATKDAKRTTHVDLICATEEQFNATGDAAMTYFYMMSLKTPKACPQKPGGAASGLSVGSVLLIIFFSLVFVYFIGGLILMRVRHGETGISMVPNRTFWTDLPFLIRDGVLFTYRSTCGGSRGYQST